MVISMFDTSDANSENNNCTKSTLCGFHCDVFNYVNVLRLVRYSAVKSKGPYHKLRPFHMAHNVTHRVPIVIYSVKWFCLGLHFVAVSARSNTHHQSGGNRHE